MHELLALELCTLLLTQPTDDSVEVAIEFIKESGTRCRFIAARLAQLNGSEVFYTKVKSINDTIHD